MKSLIKHISLFAAITLFTGVYAIAQQTSSAVMSITVEVISGSIVERSDSVQTFNPNGVEFAYGEFSMMIPDGTEILATTSDKVQMNNGFLTRDINSSMNVDKDENGKVSLRFTTKENEDLKEGFYTGIQIATIEYL